MANNLDFNNIDFGDLFGDTQTGATEVTITDEKPKTAPATNITVLPPTTPKASANVGMLQQAQAKMSAIASEMNNIFVERDELIKIMQLAVVTGTNLLMLGMPGTARFDTTI